MARGNILCKLRDYHVTVRLLAAISHKPDRLCCAKQKRRSNRRFCSSGNWI